VVVAALLLSPAVSFAVLLSLVCLLKQLLRIRRACAALAQANARTNNAAPKPSLAVDQGLARKQAPLPSGAAR